MEDIRPNIIGYHANTKDKILNCLANKNLIEYKDTDWLGKGMYFWDNIGNAHYWKNEKIRKEEGTEIEILQANIYIDEVLDLTDTQNLKFINNLWERFVSGNLKKDIPQNQLGKRLDYLFEAFSDKFSYGVIKAYGKYKTEHTTFYSFFKGSNISIRNKIIYSVKKNECITNYKLYKEEGSSYE